jgi:phosphohistidine phosphatase
MKTLLLMRHAKSSWKHPELSDFERPLNKRGRRDAPWMGRVLLQQGLQPDVIVSSPAVRALMTARLAAEQLDFNLQNIRAEPALYGATIDQYLRVIKNLPDDVTVALVVGHNPTISEFVNILAPGSVGEMPTSGVIALSLDLNGWRDVTVSCGRLVLSESPPRDAS